MTRTLFKVEKKIVKAYLDKGIDGGLIAWWDDPRSKCPSMKYPISSQQTFVNLVEQFRKEGMQVIVNWMGKEVQAEPKLKPVAS